MYLTIHVYIFFPETHPRILTYMFLCVHVCVSTPLCSGSAVPFQGKKIKFGDDEDGGED